MLPQDVISEMLAAVKENCTSEESCHLMSALMAMDSTLTIVQERDHIFKDAEWEVIKKGLVLVNALVAERVTQLETVVKMWKSLPQAPAS